MHIFSVACVVGSCHRTTEGRFDSVGAEHLSARCDHFQYPGTRRVVKNYPGSYLGRVPDGYPRTRGHPTCVLKPSVKH